MTFKPNAHWSFTSTYSYAEQAKDGLEQCNTLLFTSYLMQRSGNGDFYNMKVHTASLYATFKDVRYGLFSSLRTGYNYRPNSILYAHQLEGVVYRSIATAHMRSGRTFHASGNLTKEFGTKLSVELAACRSAPKSIPPPEPLA